VYLISIDTDSSTSGAAINRFGKCARHIITATNERFSVRLIRGQYRSTGEHIRQRVNLNYKPNRRLGFTKLPSQIVVTPAASDARACTCGINGKSQPCVVVEA
jgi:hypothetical protein